MTEMHFKPFIRSSYINYFDIPLAEGKRIFEMSDHDFIRHVLIATRSDAAGVRALLMDIGLTPGSPPYDLIMDVIIRVQLLLATDEVGEEA